MENQNNKFMPDKELLLRDLCARLPYKLHCCVFRLNGDIKENDDILYGVMGDNVVTLKSDNDECLMYYQIKPYLRPMSEMTDDERNELYELTHAGSEDWTFSHNAYVVIDWLNSKYLDYRGLIPMGLALEAPEGMYEALQLTKPNPTKDCSDCWHNYHCPMPQEGYDFNPDTCKYNPDNK